MITIFEKDNCTGCAVCMNICAHNAISIEETMPLGYVLPRIDTNACVDCGLCANICPVNHPLGLFEPLKAFSAISRNYDDLMTSSSGGASSVLAHLIVKRGGVVYGCVQRNYKDVAHRRIDSIEDLSKLKGSKYVQSNIGYIYCDVKKDLIDGREVLFTGTPCQIAGLKAFLRKDYDHLYLVDLVCHGVPSQKLLREDVEYLLKDYPIVDKNKVYVEFRRKKQHPQERFEPDFGNFISLNVSIRGGRRKKKKQKFLNDNYITAFMAGTIFRENCYNCPYAQRKRIGDVTIADFWGLEGKSVPSTEGVSLLMPSTEKGLKLVDACESYLYYEERPVEEAVNGNGQLQNPSSRPEEREIFVKYYPRNPQKAYKLSLKKYKDDYQRKVVRPRICKRYEQMIQSDFLLRTLDKVPRFRWFFLGCAYAYAKFNNIVPE